MPREKPDYRATIALINETVPIERQLLTLDDMLLITGYKTRDSVRKHFPSVCGGKFNKATVARILSGSEVM